MAEFSFSHDPALLQRFPDLQVAVLRVDDLDGIAAPALDPAPHLAGLAERLQATPEGEWPSIKAWRAAYGAMGLKPTQYRSAAEALLRRIRTDGALPRIHPVVDFCNAVSAAAAIPLAVFDIDRVEGALTVTLARGEERYLTFGGETEHPAPGEVIFRDRAGAAHARRWVNRQSALSAVSPQTRSALLVAEAMHAGAADELTRMAEALRAGFAAAGAGVVAVAHPRSPL